MTGGRGAAPRGCASSSTVLLRHPSESSPVCHATVSPRGAPSADAPPSGTSNVRPDPAAAGSGTSTGSPSIHAHTVDG